MSSSRRGSHVATALKDNSLLMTCRVRVKAPSGLSTEARGLLDTASLTSFISERLAQHLRLPHTQQTAQISGVAGISHKSLSQSVAYFSVLSSHRQTKEIPVSAIVVPKVTCDLPLSPVSFNPCWEHLSGLQLADPEFGKPGRVDLLLGIDVFVEVMMHGRRIRALGSPVAFETLLGWVLAGRQEHPVVLDHAITLHTSVLSGDDVIQRFWEVEERIPSAPIMSAEERHVIKHFKEHHSRAPDGRFIVPLPKKSEAGVLGESRSSAVRRFLSLERSLHTRGQFNEFSKVMGEYFDAGHAEKVPETSVDRPPQKTFYLPMHAVRKDSSTTTKLRAVFDASARSSTGVLLNDLLLVGPMVQSSLVDVLIRFRTHRIALTTDIS